MRIAVRTSRPRGAVPYVPEPQPTKAEYRRCSKCKALLPRADFYRDISRPDNIAAWCMACTNERRKRSWAAKKDLTREGAVR